LITEQVTLTTLIETRQSSNAIMSDDVSDLGTALATDSKSHVNVHLMTGETPLLYAILTRDTQAVKWLLEHGADVNIEGAYYEMEPDVGDMCVARWLSPVYAAVECGDVDITEAVIERAPATIFIQSYKWERVCELAITKHAVRLVELLVTKCKPSKPFGYPWKTHCRRMLHLAAKEGVRAIVEHLLLVGDPNSVNEEGEEPALFHAALNNHVDVCRLLIERGTQVNRDKPYYKHLNDYCDLLFSAIRRCSLSTVELLLSLGCSYNDEEILLNSFLQERGDKFGGLYLYGSKLHAAVLVSSLPIVRLLVERCGASLTSLDGRESTVVHLAAMNSDAVMVNELLKMISASGHDISEFLTRRSKIYKLPNGISALQYAIKANGVGFYKTDNKYDVLDRKRSEELLELLQVFLKWQVDFRQELDVTCCHALSIVIACDRPDVLLSMINCHFDLPVSINQRCLCKQTNTPLEVAVKCQSVAMMRTLISYGADVHRVTSGDTTLLHYAALWNPSVSVVFDVLTDAGLSWNTVCPQQGSILHVVLAHSTDITIIRYRIDTSFSAKGRPVTLLVNNNVLLQNRLISLLIRSYMPKKLSN
jgi:ankyrin repeat protein